MDEQHSIKNSLIHTRFMQAIHIQNECKILNKTTKVLSLILQSEKIGE
jgi:hypothetical protein